MITREQKEKQVQELKGALERSKAGFLVRFQGLNVEQMTKIRKDLKTKGQAEMKVFRNTLVYRSLEPSAQKHFSSSLKQPNAFVFAFEDPCKTAKVLSDHAEETQILKIIAGRMENQNLTLQEIQALAKLPPIDVLKAQLLSVLQAPMSQLLNVFSAVPKGMLQAMSAYKNQKQKKE